MDAVVPTSLKLQDLDRAELLQLVEERPYFWRLADLWSARHQVASARALDALQREIDTEQAWFACFHAQLQARAAGRPASAAALRELARLEMAKASAALAYRRADAAKERAWKNLQACWDRGR